MAPEVSISKVPAAADKPPKGEHIFPNTLLTEKVLRWKEHTAREEHEAAFLLLEEIICDSTPMFERLAQYEGFHHTVELPQLVQAAREKVARWLLACDVKEIQKGKLFSWFSTCAKHAFLSEVAKQRQYTTRNHAASDTIEKFVGQEDHAALRHDASLEVKQRVDTIAVRWGDPQELGAVRFVVDCLADEERQPPDKLAVTQGAMFAYGLSPEMAKYFYSYGLYAMRDAFLDKKAVPFTVQDALRMKEAYSYLPDFIDKAGWEVFLDLVKTMGGQRIKLPTLAQLRRNHEDFMLRHELDHTDLTPEEFDKVARRRGRTAKSAAELYGQLSETLSRDVTGEYGIHDPEFY